MSSWPELPDDWIGRERELLLGCQVLDWIAAGTSTTSSIHWHRAELSPLTKEDVHHKLVAGGTCWTPQAARDEDRGMPPRFFWGRY